MGWLFTQGQSLKDLMHRRTKTHTDAREDGVVFTWTCLKRCFRGNVCFSGTLWTVWEISYTKDGEDVMPRKRFIGCDLLRYHKGYGWGYKDMDEGCHPYYYNCPFSYLKMVPCVNAQWRIGVSSYHAKKRKERQERKEEKERREKAWAEVRRRGILT